MRGCFTLIVGVIVLGTIISLFQRPPTAESLKTMPDHKSVEFSGMVEAITLSSGGSAQSAKIDNIRSFAVSGMTVEPDHGEVMILDMNGHWKHKGPASWQYMGEADATLSVGRPALIKGFTRGGKVVAHQIGVP